MKDFPVTPQRLRTLAAQTGFDHFTIDERDVVICVVRIRGRRGAVMNQNIGKITRLDDFVAWCEAHDYEVVDDRAQQPVPAWIEDWTVRQGA